jgi:hypothetical protein
METLAVAARERQTKKKITSNSSLREQRIGSASAMDGSSMDNPN